MPLLAVWPNYTEDPVRILFSTRDVARRGYQALLYSFFTKQGIIRTVGLLKLIVSFSKLSSVNAHDVPLTLCNYRNSQGEKYKTI